MTLKNNKFSKLGNLNKFSKHNKFNKFSKLVKTRKHGKKIYEHGGTLLANEIFKKILSIGYEFETGGLIKFSLKKDNKTLINSDLSLRFLKERTDKKIIKQIDNNYLEVDEKGEDDDELKIENLSSDEQLGYEGNPEAFKEEQERYKKEREQEKYLDYFYENREGDGDSVKFQITNDLGVTSMTNLAYSLCKELNIPKNEMYYLKTSNPPHKTYNIHFAKDIRKKTDCETFSDVEYVVTYYNPKIGPNIILDTFIDACSRISDHLRSFTENRVVELYIKNKKLEEDPISLGNIERRLYHKPGTNLYYLDAFKSEELDINDACFTPQMTFRAKSKNCLDVMKQMVVANPSYKIDEDTAEIIKEEYDIVIKIENIVGRLLKKVKNLKESNYKKLECYVFFIIYKLYAFIFYHAEITAPPPDNNTAISYLKDYTAFNCRHHGNELYQKVKDILKNDCHMKDEDVKKIFMQPNIIKELYEHKTEVYDTNAYEVDSLPDDNENFGNPWVSFISYFDYMDKRESDWLFDNEYNKYTTMFPLVEDVMIIECRLFKPSIMFYLKNNNFKVTHEGCITLTEMVKLVNKFSNDSEDGLKDDGKMQVELAPQKKDMRFKSIGNVTLPTHIRFEQEQEQEKEQIDDKESAKKTFANTNVTRKRKRGKGEKGEKGEKDILSQKHSPSKNAKLNKHIRFLQDDEVKS